MIATHVLPGGRDLPRDATLDERKAEARRRRLTALHAAQTFGRAVESAQQEGRAHADVFRLIETVDFRFPDGTLIDDEDAFDPSWIFDAAARIRLAAAQLFGAVEFVDEGATPIGRCFTVRIVFYQEP